jgi:predicted esterase
VSTLPTLRGIVLALATVILGQQTQDPSKLPLALQPGVLLSHQTCLAHPEQSYALYLPSQYTPTKKWAMVYAFDPGARGKLPVELMKAAAERYAYIVVGSNNSRNGSWKVEAEAAQAMLQDTHSRFSIDDRRVYFAGFSGGARVASEIAQRCRCAAGVILSGAGFSVGSSPSRDVIFAVFSAVGNFDFNYPEVARLDQKLEDSGFPHRFRSFEGIHQWAPESTMDEALAWLRVVAMKEAREPRDDIFVTTQLAEAATRAHALEQAGELFMAWREYRQTGATFDGLADTSPLQQAVANLSSQRAVRDGAKHEKQEFDEQDQVTGPISAGLSALREVSTPRVETRSQIEQNIIALRERVAHEKRPDSVRILKRALGGILVEALDLGQERMEAKDLAVANDYFQLACNADPDSSWALSNLATTRALTGDRKGTLEALRHAREKTKDLGAFSAWLKDEPAFATMREDPQFRVLLANP